MKTETFKYPPLPKLEQWLKNASPHLHQRLADLAGTTVGMYRQWVPGRRGVSAAMAGKLEQAMEHLSSTEVGVPTLLRRGDFCHTCAECDYYKQVREHQASDPDIDDLK